MHFAVGYIVKKDPNRPFFKEISDFRSNGLSWLSNLRTRVRLEFFYILYFKYVLKDCDKSFWVILIHFTCEHAHLCGRILKGSPYSPLHFWDSSKMTTLKNIFKYLWNHMRSRNFNFEFYEKQYEKTERAKNLSCLCFRLSVDRNDLKRIFMQDDSNKDLRGS